jgi:hypothetical protein
MEKFPLLMFLLLLELVMVALIIMGRTFSPERRILALVARVLVKKKPDPTTTTVNNTDRSSDNELILPKQHDSCSCF